MPKTSKKQDKVKLSSRQICRLLDNASKIEKLKHREWHSIRSMLCYWYCIFFIMLGSREIGKSYSVTEFFVSQWKKHKIPFYWLRLNEASMKKLLSNNAEKLVDPDLYRKYDLKLTVKGNTVYDHGERMATVLALSTFANDKGVALFDKDFLNDKDMYYHIALDEFQLEKTQKSQGDIAYQFVQQMENICRSTKKRMRVFLIGNTLEECSDILTLFNFIPEELGRYRLIKNKKKLIEYLHRLEECNTDAERAALDAEFKNYDFGKRAIIDYLPNNEAYMNRRHGTIGDILYGDHSNFTNKIEFDKSLVTKQRLHRPTGIIVFDKQTKFTLWDSNIIAEYNGEQCKNKIAMRPYQDLLFNQEYRDSIIANFDARVFLYKNLITAKKFQKEIQQIKPRKQ